jgi:hypothetical protein
MGLGDTPVANPCVTEQAGSFLRPSSAGRFGRRHLVAPGKSIPMPSTALVDSVRNPPRPRRVVGGDGPVRATLGASVRPALPDSLLGKWRGDIKVVTGAAAGPVTAPRPLAGSRPAISGPWFSACKAAGQQLVTSASNR